MDKGGPVPGLFRYSRHTVLPFYVCVCYLLKMERDFSNEFVHEILTLLDRIDIEEDHSLAAQRHDIAEKYGLTVIFRHSTSGEMN